jgi:hypothetical protein
MEETLEETKSLWNTPVNQLTVGQTLVVSVATPIVMIGGAIAIATVANGVSKVRGKFEKAKADRKVRKTEPIEEK